MITRFGGWLADCVVTEETEFERAGLAGGAGTAGAGVEVGLGFAAEVAGVGGGAWVVDGTPVFTCGVVGFEVVYGWPSSPEVKERVEQKPSDELMINVRPSFDLVIVD